MKVFIAHSSHDAKPVARELAVKLRQENVHAFLDEDDLPPGEGYDGRIRAAINHCDVFIFLLTTGSMTPGSYTLTELGYAKKRWPNPEGRVLPVVIGDVDLKQVDAYLTSVTVLKPRGNVATETWAEAGTLLKRIRRKQVALGGGVGLVVVALAAAGWHFAHPAAHRDLATAHLQTETACVPSRVLEPGGAVGSFTRTSLTYFTEDPERQPGLVLEGRGKWSRVRVTRSEPGAEGALFSALEEARQVKSPLGAWPGQLWISLGDGSMCEPRAGGDTVTRSCPVDDRLKDSTKAAKLITIAPNDAVATIDAGGRRVYEAGAPVGCFVIPADAVPEIAMDLSSVSPTTPIRVPTGSIVTLSSNKRPIGKTRCPLDSNSTLTPFSVPRGTKEITVDGVTTPVWTRLTDGDADPWLCGPKAGTALPIKVKTNGPDFKPVIVHPIVVKKPLGSLTVVGTIQETWAPKTNSKGGCRFEHAFCTLDKGWSAIPTCNDRHKAAGPWVSGCGPAPTCEPILVPNHQEDCDKSP